MTEIQMNKIKYLFVDGVFLLFVFRIFEFVSDFDIRTSNLNRTM